MKKLYSLLLFALLLSCNNQNQQNTEQVSTVYAEDSQYTIETSQSSITWTGRELSTSYHYGTINLLSGQFEVSNGIILNGEFIVDMTSINNQDMEGDRKARLEGHLKSDDFFSVDAHPTALLSIQESQLISEGKWNVTANLTIKG
ncbi:MAG: YceI family protein, partial [Bacteroidota bacterium]